MIDWLIYCVNATTSLSSIRCGFAPGFVNYKKGALDSQLQVIKFTSCLPMVGGSLRVFWLPPPLKLFAMIRPPSNWRKYDFFGVKSWFFTRNTPKIFAPPFAIGKNMIFWRKIVIFHTKYPKHFKMLVTFLLQKPKLHMKYFIQRF
jgi:hypothetical protein